MAELSSVWHASLTHPLLVGEKILAAPCGSTSRRPVLIPAVPRGHAASHLAIAGSAAAWLCRSDRAGKGKRSIRRSGIPATTQSFRPVDGEVIAVVGAGGNVGRLVTQGLCELGNFKVHAVVRDVEAAKSWAAELSNLTLFEADTRDYAALYTALKDASVVVCTTGVPAFGFSGQWKDGNHPVSADHYGVKNAVNAFAAGDSVAKRRFVVMSSIGVKRRDSFPYLILNGGGVLDAKAAGEAAVREVGKNCGFSTAIVRPGQLFGGPYDNNRYLGTLFELDKDSGTQKVSLVQGDTAVGDTVRSSLAGVLVRCAVSEGLKSMDFAVISEDGDAPTEDAIDGMLSTRNLTSALDGDTGEALSRFVVTGGLEPHAPFTQHSTSSLMV